MTTIDGARRRETDPIEDSLATLPDAARAGRAGSREIDPHAISTSPLADAALGQWARSRMGAKEVSGAATVRDSQGAKGLSSKDVTYIGMNGGEGTEGVALARGTGVHVARHDDAALLDGHTYDLQKPDARDAFASALVSDPARARTLSAVLSGTMAKSETAHLAVMLARAENGKGLVPSRLVLSGHNYGEGPYGARALGFSTIQDVAKVFPKGAALVESIQFSACSSARELDVNRAQWQSAFPGLTSMWGYEGTCPLAASGGADYAAAWEQRTHGGSELRTTPSERAAHVAVWTVQHGYDSRLARDPIAQRDALARATNAVVSSRTEGYRTGTYPTAEHHGQLEGDYRALQNAAARADLPAELHERFVSEAATIAGVFTFDHHDGVRDRFAASHGKETSAALHEAGLPARDFSAITYEGALACKKEIDDSVAATATPPASLLGAQRNLTELLALDTRRTETLFSRGRP